MELEELGKLKHNDKNMDAILKFVSQVQNAKIKKTQDHVNMAVVGIADLREDIVEPSISQKEALANAKKQDGKYFIVPQVVE